MFALLWADWRHHPWRQAVAVLAVALGVALAFAVHLINASALAEFGAAVRAVNGQPDFELRAAGGAGFDEQLYARVAAHAQVAVASPVVEFDTFTHDAAGRRWPLRVVGIDALVAPAVAPALQPQVASARSGDAATAGGVAAWMDPRAAFLNPAAQRALGHPAHLQLQWGSGWQTFSVRGDVAVDGPALAVLDIAGAQAAFGRLGRLSRIDVRLQPGADAATVLRELALPADVRAAAPDEAQQRVSNLSQAYRVNLTVLALVALFTGAFLVFSVQALSVAMRWPQWALLGVLGMSAHERLRAVLAESALLGLAGAVLGMALGTALAALALAWLGGDLGSGMLGSAAPRLQWDSAAAALYGALGLLAALAGGWVPARLAQRIAPAQALKGLGSHSGNPVRPWLAPALVAAAAALALAPPVAGVPVAAYAAVAVLLLGGIASVPLWVAALLRILPRPRHATWLLALQRASDQRHTATVAVAGAVAALSLVVALTVMVASFRGSVARWLDQVLPADLYVRSADSSSVADTAFLPTQLAALAQQLPGVARIQTQRIAALPLDPAQPPATLLVRHVDDPQRSLPLVGALLPAQAGTVSVYATEPFAARYGVQPGSRLALPLPDGHHAEVFVRALWRDYARQQGALAMDVADWQLLSGDQRSNDLLVWLQPGASALQVQTQLRQLLQQLGQDPATLTLATAGDIRTESLRIFDRSFAVTYWLQAVATGIGLFGIAAHFSAQVLARRKELGTLQHLGFTRAQLLAMVALEGLAWTLAGALLGVALGLAVSVVLVHVVNPQSFHWTMELQVPWLRLVGLAAGVVVAGGATAWLAARAAASPGLALAVKDDW